MERKLIVLGSIFILIAVVLGALAAHALKEVLTVDQLSSFNTAVRYQMYHGLALLILSQIRFLKISAKKILFYLFMSGVLLFSGSIYGLILGSILELDWRFLGPITPIGGLLLIVSWIYIIVQVLRYKDENN
jgi:uncharacterized membrane protein YgdD (TMEM256/DUF423 family)